MSAIPASFSGSLNNQDRINWSHLAALSHPRNISVPAGVLSPHGYPSALDLSAVRMVTGFPKEDFPRIASLKTIDAFAARVQSLGLRLPFDRVVLSAQEGSVLADTVQFGDLTAINALAVHPMEGCNAHRGDAGFIDGSPTEQTLRGWINYGLSGAGLIWGGEAAAVRADGRANPRQTMCTLENEQGIKDLINICRFAHDFKYGKGSGERVVIGLQLTYSGRNNRPNDKTSEPRVMYDHDVYDPAKRGQVLSDTELESIIDSFVVAAGVAHRAGYNFVDVKACHGYLGHESLSGFTRTNSKYGGDNLDNRARFLLTIIDRIKEEYPSLEVGVRLSAFDSVPMGLIDQETGTLKDEAKKFLPYRYGFGVNPNNPLEIDLREPIALCKMLYDHGVASVSITAGNPYFTSNVQRPTPSDLFKDKMNVEPLRHVFNLVETGRRIKQAVPGLAIVGGGLSALENYIGNVAQAMVGQQYADFAGYGRRVLPDPMWPERILAYGDQFEWHKDVAGVICRSFLDCVAAMRSDAPAGAGCYPLIDYYKNDLSHKVIKDWRAINKPVKK